MNMQGISRIDADRAVGWYVRFYYEEGEEPRKFFSDNVYGGEKESLKAAVDYRDRVLKKNPPPPKLPYRTKPTPNNSTGFNGISRTTRRSGSRKRVYDAYGVFWCPKPGVRKSKYFYFHNFDNQREALDAAIDFRKEKEAEILKRFQRRGFSEGQNGYYVRE
jgi:hypothetical protein